MVDAKPKKPKGATRRSRLWTPAHQREALLYLLDLNRADVLACTNFDEADPTGWLVLPTDGSSQRAFLGALATRGADPARALAAVDTWVAFEARKREDAAAGGAR